jgi:hypothetical protein
MKKKRKVYPDDDGRVIAKMNVEGMPFYNPNTPKSGEEPTNKHPLPKPSFRETWRLIMDAYAAVMPVALLFIAAFALLIVFMVFVWFK